MVLLVAYDLHTPGRSYDPVARILQTANSWVHPQGSVWMIDTLQTPEYWRDALVDIGDQNDEFFVTKLSHHWASNNFDPSASVWLKDPSRTW